LTELLIIADDLTGAIEAGVLLAKQHIPSRVIHQPDFNNVALPVGEVAVLVYNTESRHIAAEEAAERVRIILKKAKAAGIKRFYKKTDSTMRGNIGAELEAFLSESGQQTIAFIPAHPRLKRFTRNGFHFIGEKLLHETEFGIDPLEPIRNSFIPELIQQQTSISVNSTSLTNAHINEKGITVFDCNSEIELADIAQFLMKNNSHHAISGSAAMVELLPKLFHLHSIHTEMPKLQAPVLLINGSLNPISRQQVFLAGKTGVKTIPAPTELMNRKKLSDLDTLHSFINLVTEAMEEHQKIIVASTPVMDSKSHEFPIKDQVSSHGFEAVSELMGNIVSGVLKNISIGTLIVFGGDTLMGIMKALGCSYIEPKSEVMPGVAISLARFGDNQILLITKPGGYGEEDVILKLMEFINPGI